jgi:AcrR family transcriptional regulator
MVMEMTGRSIDRRVARTRAMLHDALLSLLEKKAYETITAEDICARANVGRSTFYAHYTSKDDLMRSGLKQLRELLLDRQRDAAVPRDETRQGLSFSLTMFEHARDHMHLHRTLVGNRGGAIAFGMIRQMLGDLVRGELAADTVENSKDAMPRELIVQFVVGAYMAVVTWWLEGGARLAPQQIDGVFRRLATEGIASLRS